MFLEVKWLVRLPVTTSFWIGQHSLRSLPELVLCTSWLHSINEDAYYTAEKYYCWIIRKLTSNQQIHYSKFFLASLQMHQFSMTKILLRLHHSVLRTLEVKLQTQFRDSSHAAFCMTPVRFQSPSFHCITTYHNHVHNKRHTMECRLQYVLTA